MAESVKALQEKFDHWETYYLAEIMDRLPHKIPSSPRSAATRSAPYTPRVRHQGAIGEGGSCAQTETYSTQTDEEQNVQESNPMKKDAAAHDEEDAKQSVLPTEPETRPPQEAGLQEVTAIVDDSSVPMVLQKLQAKSEASTERKRVGGALAPFRSQ